MAGFNRIKFCTQLQYTAAKIRVEVLSLGAQHAFCVPLTSPNPFPRPQVAEQERETATAAVHGHRVNGAQCSRADGELRGEAHVRGIGEGGWEHLWAS